MTALRLPFTHGADNATLRGIARRALALWQAPEQVDDTLLVIAELVANVLQHTGDGGEIVLSLRGDAVRVEVSDTSRSAPRTQPPDQRRPGGRGLAIVAAVTCAWGVHQTRRGKTVWAEVPLTAPR